MVDPIVGALTGRRYKEMKAITTRCPFLQCRAGCGTRRNPLHLVSEITVRWMYSGHIAQIS